MKKRLYILFTIAVYLAVQSSAWCNSLPGTGISDTFHDLSLFGLAGYYGDDVEHGGLDRICIYCHAPHHTLIRDEMGRLPLWNHALSPNTVFMMYGIGMYASGEGLYSISPAAGDPRHKASSALAMSSAPGPVSLLCLSCHDGTIAVSAYGFFPSRSFGSLGGPRMRGRALIGGGTGDFRNHHPIGIDYNYAAALNSELNPPDMPLLGFNPYGLTINDVLSYGRIECTSCHDVHNAKSQGIKFTWVEDWRSSLCLSCHRK